jgi:arginyl-tRNA synthetase
VYLREQKKLEERLRAVLRNLYQIEPENLVIEQPPEIKFGEYALPVAFELARKLRRAPRKIAEELVSALGSVEGFAGFEVAGAGYINARLDRGAAMQEIAASSELETSSEHLHSLVEHTSINPNKAAHVGHLRNAILGDTFVRLLRAAGQKVDVQNYIDNTGVQVADIVVGLMHLEGLSLSGVQALMARLSDAGERIDFYCWDLYARASQWYEADPSQKEARKKIRLDTLHAIEQGGNDAAQIGELISTAVLRRHLETMLRLDIEYDFLPRESEILRLHFWESAFEQLKAKGVLYFETDGKNKGCWVMKRGTGRTGNALRDEAVDDLEEPAASDGPDEDAKVIVRSNGTVTYVGKDIAYQLWKFGLLGRDFGYRFWQQEGVWETTREGAEGHPRFGNAWRVFNVIDVRQSYLQKIVRAGLQAVGHAAEADRSVHFAYEMVALSPATARQLGFLDEAEGEEKLLEMSGRKGIGVKADDLMDQLIVKAREEIGRRNRDLGAAELDTLARQIAVAALRFFMVKATNNRVIAFDFDEALSFEGETGPYLQYSLVRAKNIRRRLLQEGIAADVFAEDVLALPQELWSEDLWDLVLEVAQTGETVEKATETLELSLIARHALEIAQRFNALYHRHPILQEKDPQVRAARLATVQIFRRGLETLGELLGVPVPEKM